MMMNKEPWKKKSGTKDDKQLKDENQVKDWVNLPDVQEESTNQS